MSKYICTKSWARNKVGDVIDESTFRRYPVELRDKCFKKVVELVKSEPSPVRESVVNRVVEDVDLKVTEAATVDEQEPATFEKRLKKKLAENL